jgi:hypothetical protein
MNSTSLQALIVDQHFGELSPEVTDLLENHLAQNAEARAEADRVRQTLAVTETVVLRHPELVGAVQAASAEPERVASPRSIGISWLAKAASITLLAALASTAGFFLGRNQNRAPETSAVVASDTSQRPPRKDSPWARYRVAPERSSNGIKVVRVDTTHLENSVLR